MSTTRLPPAPEPQLLSAEVSGHVAEFYGHTDAALHAYGLAVWKAAMGAAAAQVPDTWLDPLLSGPQKVAAPPFNCPQVQALLSAVRERISSLPLPEQGGPQ